MTTTVVLAITIFVIACIFTARAVRGAAVLQPRVRQEWPLAQNKPRRRAIIALMIVLGLVAMGGILLYAWPHIKVSLSALGN